MRLDKAMMLRLIGIMAALEIPKTTNFVNFNALEARLRISTRAMATFSFHNTILLDSSLNHAEIRQFFITIYICTFSSPTPSP